MTRKYKIYYGVLGSSEGPWAGGERREAHDGGQGVQAEGQASTLRAGEQHCGDQGREYGLTQGKSYHLTTNIFLYCSVHAWRQKKDRTHVFHMYFPRI